MLKDPYAVLRALLRAEASRDTAAPKPVTAPTPQGRPRPAPKRDHDRR